MACRGARYSGVPNVACQQQQQDKKRQACRIAFSRRTGRGHVWFAWPPAKSGVIAFAGVHAADCAYVLPVLHIPEGSRASSPQGGQARYAAEAREWGMVRDGCAVGCVVVGEAWCSWVGGHSLFTRQADARPPTRRRAALSQRRRMRASNGWFLFEGADFTCFSA
jgi:hypothetical protein